MCFSSSEERPKSDQTLSAGKKEFCEDGFTKISVSDAGVLRRGSAWFGLFGCRSPRLPAGSPARQAEKTPGVSPWSISHPYNRKHFFSGHRAARLPQEAKRSSRTGNDSDCLKRILTLQRNKRGLCRLRRLQSVRLS